jgi:archaellum component FlaG (FlaF/FlaG flagellin family)
MSIAIAYWLLGLGGSFTKFDKVEFPTAYADTESNGNFTLTLNLKNTGSATAAINADQILYNGKPASAYGAFAPVCNATTIVMNPGEQSCTTIKLDGTNTGTPWISGMTVEVKLHSTGGKDYPRAIILP